jgi:hypothetical protein
MSDNGHTFGCVDPFAHSIEFHGTEINQVILQIKPDGTVLWKGREVESDADFRAAMMEVHQHMCGSANAEITCLRAEVAALKANDPLAEMWRELAEYQPQADRDGHGDSWRAMCEERTEEAAWAAYMARQGSSHVRAAAYCAWQQAQRDATARRLSKDAVKWAADALAAIRRAKEEQP